MAEEIGGDAVTCEVCHLEWKGDNQIGHVAAKALHTPLLPGPYLRCYVIDHRNAKFMQPARQTKIESGIMLFHHGDSVANVMSGKINQPVNIGDPVDLFLGETTPFQADRVDAAESERVVAGPRVGGHILHYPEPGRHHGMPADPFELMD